MACKLSDLAERTEMSYVDDKRAVSQDEFVLERVQGLTSTHLHSLASNPLSGWVAFPAACVLVLLDPKTNEQKFIESPSLRNISCCAFTDDGRFVAFGETGMKPHIAMWNLRDHKECHKFVADTTVRAIFFHPTSPILISLGLKDNVIVVWDYVKGMRMASCKWQTMPLSLTIPRVGSSLVVCGHRKITLFNISKVGSRSYETNVFEDRRTVLLGKHSEYTFVDIESGRGKHERTVYTVTSCGYLCEVKLGDILIDKAIKVDTQTFCVKYSTELLFVGCPAGLVKICDPDNLTVTAAVSLSNLLGPSAVPKVGNKGFIDVCTLVVDENEKIVTCVYADCSMHSWQIGTDGQKIVCSAIEPGSGTNGTSGPPVSKSNLLRAFIGCCEKTKAGNEFLNKFSLTEHNKPLLQYGGRRLVNENRASYQNANAVRFTPDGKDVICGNEEGEIKVYELSTGILRRVIEAHSSQVTCIELMYDDDFQLVCSGGRDRVMFVLNARTDFSLVQVLCDHSAAITAISLVNHKGVLTLVSAAADNVILIRRAILGGTLRFTITGEIAQTNCNRSFFVTSDYIALGGKDSQIKVFKADPVFVSKPMKTINCQKLCPSNAGFRAIDIDPSGSFMAVSQANGNISVYHLQTGQPVASLPLQSDINSIQFSSDLKYMVSSTSNGCDLVWRLPERMTEFMRSRQDKTYQVETNKEVTYQTYMSCVKVCKEGLEGEEEEEEEEDFPNQPSPKTKAHRGIQEGLHRSHVAQNSSNHNSEWDHTPSIESMSILDHYTSRAFGARKEVGGEKSIGCSTCESVISCSTCTHSVSTTTHTSCISAAPSDSSVSTTDGHGRSNKHLRFYCGADHKLFGQVIDETKCIKVGPFKNAVNKSESNAVPIKMSVNDHTANGLSEQQKLNTEENRQSSLTEKMEDLAINSAEIDSEMNSESCEENEQVLSVISNDKSQLKNSAIDRKPVEFDTPDVPAKESLEQGRKNKADIEYNQSNKNTFLPDNNFQDVSEISGRSSFVAPPAHRSKKILEKAIFYEGVMRGEIKPSYRAASVSPTRQHTSSVKDAVSMSRSKPDERDDTTPKAEGGSDVSPRHWTPLTTPEYSNTSSDITNLVPNTSGMMVETCGASDDIHSQLRMDASIDQLARDCETMQAGIQSGEPAGKVEIPNTNFQETSLIKPASDNTQQEVFRIHNDKECVQNSQGEIYQPQQYNIEIAPANHPLPANKPIVQGQGDAQIKPLVEHSISIGDKVIPNNEARAVIKQIVEDHKRAKLSAKDADEEPSVIQQLEKEGFNVPEKYHTALRSCMQLSNSQETFATLRVDTNDLELMAFLSEALKRKLVAAGLVGLSHDEIDNLLKTGMPPNCVAGLSQAKQKVLNEELTKNISCELNTSSVEHQHGDSKIEIAEKPTTQEHIFTQHEGEKESPKFKNVPSGSKCQNAETKKGMYKTFMNKFACSRKKMTNKSANRSNTESDLDEQQSLNDCTSCDDWLDNRCDDNNILTNQDTYAYVECSDESNVFIMKNKRESNKNIDECVSEKTPTSSTKDSLNVTRSVKRTPSQRCPSSTRDASSDRRRVGPTRRNPIVSASSDVPAYSGYTSVSPSNDQCLSEGRGLNTWRSKVTEDNGKSRADSLVSSQSKDMSSQQSCASDSGVDASSRKGDKRLAEMFRDQDEYLRRLKEVRENFERSIRALSEERKFKQAAEDGGSGAQ